MASGSKHSMPAGQPTVAQRGFTLIEMIIAIGIFALIATVAYTTLTRFIADREKMEVRNDYTQRLQTLFNLLERDIRYAVHRPVRSNYNTGVPDKVALCFDDDDDCAEGDRLRLTTHQLEPTSYNPMGGRLARVAWRLEGKDLVRASWEILDRVEDTTERRRIILSDVDEISIKAYKVDDAENEQVVPPDIGNINPIAAHKTNQFPAGVVEVLVNIKGNQYRRLLEIANGA